MEDIILHGREIRRLQILPVDRGQLTCDEQSDNQTDVRDVIGGDHKFQIALVHRRYGSVNRLYGQLD